MSRDFFTNIPAKSYAAQLASWPIALCEPSNAPRRAVVATFDWQALGASSVIPNLAVKVNLEGNAPQKKLDRIASVKIDNLGNPFPVYVYFPDTQDTIVAPANCIVWEPVITNSYDAVVIIEGATTGTAGSTKVYFTNVFMPPYVDHEIDQAVTLLKGSPLIQRTGALQPGYAAPAIGDQFSSLNVVFAGINQAQFVLGAFPNQFYYITSVEFNLSASSTSAATQVDFTLEEFGTGVTLMRMGCVLPAGPLVNNVSLLRSSGFNIRVASDIGYAVYARGFPATIVTVNMYWLVSYTLSPS